MTINLSPFLDYVLCWQTYQSWNTGRWWLVWENAIATFHSFLCLWLITFWTRVAKFHLSICVITTSDSTSRLPCANPIINIIVNIPSCIIRLFFSLFSVVAMMMIITLISSMNLPFSSSPIIASNHNSGVWVELEGSEKGRIVQWPVWESIATEEGRC